MRSELDLTNKRDFDPNKFKIKRRVTYDHGNGEISRIPWKKDGTRVNVKFNGWVFINNSAWNGISWDTFNNLTYTATYNDMDEYILYRQLLDNTTVTWSFNDTSRNFTTTANINDYIGYNDLSFTYNSAYNTRKIYYKEYKSYPNDFRVGKVSRIKNHIITSSRKSSHFKYKEKSDSIIRDLEDKYNRICYLKYERANRLNRDAIRYKYYEYDRYLYDDLYVTAKDYNKSRRSSGKSSRHDHVRWLYHSYINTPMDDVCRPRIHNIRTMVDVTGSPEYGEKRRIKWPDFHDDYIREMEGLRPRNDWRRGIKAESLYDIA